MVMYFLIALLEDCGYMARATVVLDPIFQTCRSFRKIRDPYGHRYRMRHPGGSMASRTIRNERERRTTAMLTPFMPCGAKIPVIALFAGAFFADAWWVSATMYLVGILLVLLGALLVKKITGQKYRKSFFIIELPEYKLPSLKRATVSMLERGKAYIKKAGDHHPGLQHRSTDHAELHLAVPVGGGRSGRELPSLLLSLILLRSCPSLWASAYGSLQRRPSPAFIAKENVVGTLAVVYGVTNLIDTDELALVGSGNEVAAVMGLTKVAALAYLMFNLYTPPCFAALGAMNSEMKSAKWLWEGSASSLPQDIRLPSLYIRSVH